MKRLIIILFIAYALLGLAGFVDLGRMSYYDVDGFADYTRAFIPLRIVVAGLFTWVLFEWYRKYAPEQYEKRKEKWSYRIFSPLITLGLFFALNTGLLLPLNHLNGRSGNIHIAGIVMNKDSRYKAKSGRDYFLSVTDTLISRNYFFKVHKNVYSDFRQDDPFVKDMKKGWLGIIYREEE